MYGPSLLLHVPFEIEKFMYMYNQSFPSGLQNEGPNDS